MPVSPPRVLLRPDSTNNDRDLAQVWDNTPATAPMRSRSVRFAERNSRAMVSSPQSLLPNPWGSGENYSPPPLPPPQLTGPPSERVQMFQLPESAMPEARSLKAAGLPAIHAICRCLCEPKLDRQAFPTQRRITAGVLEMADIKVGLSNRL